MGNQCVSLRAASGAATYRLHNVSYLAHFGNAERILVFGYAEDPVQGL